MLRLLLSALAALSLLVSSGAHAQSIATQYDTLLSNPTLNSSTPTTGVSLKPVWLGDQNMMIVLKASNVSGTTPTLDLSVASCPTATYSAVNCFLLYTFDQCTTGSCFTDGSRHVWPDTGIKKLFPYLVVVPTLGGTSPVYNVTLEVWR